MAKSHRFGGAGSTVLRQRAVKGGPAFRRRIARRTGASVPASHAESRSGNRFPFHVRSARKGCFGSQEGSEARTAHSRLRLRVRAGSVIASAAARLEHTHWTLRHAVVDAQRFGAALRQRKSCCRQGSGGWPTLTGAALRRGPSGLQRLRSRGFVFSSPSGGKAGRVYPVRRMARLFWRRRRLLRQGLTAPWQRRALACVAVPWLLATFALASAGTGSAHRFRWGRRVARSVFFGGRGDAGTEQVATARGQRPQ